jgi:hypothetical protein
MASYLVAALFLVVALTAVLLFPEAVVGHIKRLYAWATPSQPSDTGPSFAFRAWAMLAAYFAAAGVVFVASLLSGGSTFANPLYWPWALFVIFPFGLARFFNWDSLFGLFGPQLIYLALTVQLIIPHAKVYWALFGIFVLLLCFNVHGCFQPVI